MSEPRVSGHDSHSIGIVGPAHPLKGGIAQHTAELARQSAARGLAVRIESWRSQYPRCLYPGEQQIPEGSTEGEPFAGISRRLRWWSPLSWVLAGRRLRAAEVVVLAVVVPFHAVPYRVLLAALRRGPKRPSVFLICHNVLPHEGGPLDEPLMRVLLGAADVVLVHTIEQGEIARSLGAHEVRVVSIPPFVPFAQRDTAVGRPVAKRLIFFGFVRPYKGLDDLLDAIAQTEDVRLTVCGEIWGDPSAVHDKVAGLGLQDRVTVEDRYVRAEEIPTIFAEHDALVAPYRTATASQHVQLAHQVGLPIIATRVGSFPRQVRDNHDGLLCEPGDATALAAAIRSLYEPGVLERLRRNVRNVDTSRAWDAYIDALAPKLSTVTAETPA